MSHPNGTFRPEDRRHAPGPGLPVPLGQGAGERPCRPFPVAAAGFVSQLIAERDHLPPQRQRRRVPLADALGSYDAAATIGLPRLPPGYRKSVLA